MNATMKHKRWLIGFVIITLIITYVVYQDYLPPQTPQKRARLISELMVPHNAKVLAFQDDDAAPISDWRLLVVLELDRKEYRELTAHLNSEWKLLNKGIFSRFHINRELCHLHSGRRAISFK